MNKKINFLAILPYSSIVLMIWLCIRFIMNQIYKKTFNRSFWSCGIIGVAAVLILTLFVLILSNIFHFSQVQVTIARVITIILSGYIMNLYTFIFFNKKWVVLSSTPQNQQ